MVFYRNKIFLMYGIATSHLLGDVFSAEVGGGGVETELTRNYTHSDGNFQLTGNALREVSNVFASILI